MSRFTVEEINLISIYHTGTHGAAVQEMTAALPFMDGDMKELAGRVLDKLCAMTDAEYSRLALDPADERDEG